VRSANIEPVLEFLWCRTPAAWVDAALADLPTVLRDHAALELKAAQQAQRLIWTYGMRERGNFLRPQVRAVLRAKLSRLAREELRHFEQVLDLLERRGIGLTPVSASRYAATLHGRIATVEPARLADTLVVSAIIEARSCERFATLLPALRSRDTELAAFYESLLASERRHFRDYLELARSVTEADLTKRAGRFLDLDRTLVSSTDVELRFHSGVCARSA